MISAPRQTPTSVSYCCGPPEKPCSINWRLLLSTLQDGQSRVIEVILGNKNSLHNSYQDFQAFLDNGGKMGLQHDVLLYGAYALNPFLVKVTPAPMLVVKQGEVAVIKSYVGLSTVDTSDTDFKFGALVRPGHRGIWREPLRTGKYVLNPQCYKAELIPTAILTLNWADATSKAHNLDKDLSQIIAKSKEGFEFRIDLQVQIHVADTQAPYVISMVGTMYNLANEVLQAAVGNHFRDKVQSKPAMSFIEERQSIQEQALAHIRSHLDQYKVETRGVYIQDVILPQDLVKVLKEREIANQEVKTLAAQRLAQDERVKTEAAKGQAGAYLAVGGAPGRGQARRASSIWEVIRSRHTLLDKSITYKWCHINRMRPVSPPPTAGCARQADMQFELAKSAVGIEIKENNARARERKEEAKRHTSPKPATLKGRRWKPWVLPERKVLKLKSRPWVPLRRLLSTQLRLFPYHLSVLR